MKEIRKDVFGNTPKIGDEIAFNPPGYKGLVTGLIVSFSKDSGLPRIKHAKPTSGLSKASINNDGTYTPKTGFVTNNNKK